jgi:hypothetical protein
MITLSMRGRPAAGGSGGRSALVNPYPTLLALVLVHAGARWPQIGAWHQVLGSAGQLIYGAASLQVTAITFLWLRSGIRFEGAGSIRLGTRAGIEFGRPGGVTGGNGSVQAADGDGHGQT